MVHSKTQKFILAIRSEGQVLREINGSVFLAPDSKYQIRIKNPHSYNAGVRITVDGTLLHDSLIIINAHSTFDLKRMMVDGDLSNGPELVFVKKDDGRVQDPTVSELGEVKVEFFNPVHYFSDIWMSPPCSSPDIHQIPNGLRQSPHQVLYGANSGDVNYSSDEGPSLTRGATFSSPVVNWCMSTTEKGATIPGQATTQEFVESSEEFEVLPCDVLRLSLCVKKETLFSKVKKGIFCTTCGCKNKPSFKFCPQCGTERLN